MSREVKRFGRALSVLAANGMLAVGAREARASAARAVECQGDWTNTVRA
jgi:hypothetical protein